MVFSGFWSDVAALYGAYVVAFNMRVYSIRVKAVVETENQGATRQDGRREVVGLIHLHSEYSKDAQGSYEELAATAAAQGLDFLIVTDHNTMAAAEQGKQGWYGKTLVLTGVESSRREGFLLGLALGSYPHTRKTPTDRFLRQVEEENGIALIAHADNSHWPWKGAIDPRIAGLEIVDFADQAWDASWLTKLFAALYYVSNRSYAFLHLYRRPRKVLALWDAEGARRPFIGIIASDLHQNIGVGDWRIKFPKAAAIMPFAYNHLIASEPLSDGWQAAARMIHDAVRQGHLFMAVDLLGDARGFMFEARQGESTAIMGDTLATAETTFSVRLPTVRSRRRLRLHVYRNGELIHDGEARPFDFTDHRPGAYRVEIVIDMPTFWGPSRSVTWIFSNPIYLR